jgi:hypothetical protein
VVSALLLGGRVTVPEGRDVGGSFQHLPACRTKKQTQCVVAYNSFDTTPPSDSLFGRVAELGSGVLSGTKPGDHVLCVNPATLGAESGRLDSFFKTEPFPSTLGAVEKPQFDEPTPWVETPGQYTATCMESDGTNWLQIDHDPNDARPAVFPALGANWGLHLVDVNLALGNLVDLVGTQAKAYAAKNRR